MSVWRIEVGGSALPWTDSKTNADSTVFLAVQHKLYLAKFWKT